MKNPVKPIILTLFTLAAGILGMLLRFWLFSTGVDASGLLVTGHPANILIYVTFAITLAAVAVCAINSKKTPVNPFPASLLGSVGAFIGAVGILTADFMELDSHDFITFLSFILGILAAAGFVYSGICRLSGKRNSLLAHSVITVYLMIHLVFQYRQWSSEPQLQNYFFPLLASIFLMLCCYYRAALELKGTGYRWYVFCNLAGLFCCCLSMNTESWIFYLAMALWTATDLYIPGKATVAVDTPQEEA